VAPPVAGGLKLVAASSRPASMSVVVS